MDAHAVTAYTTNGKPSVSKAAAGDPRCSAFFKLVRGLSREALKEHLSDILSQADGHEAVVDAFVLYAQTRDVRGGKGERDLARWWLCELSQRFPATVEALVPMVPDFGSWRDLTAFLEEDRAALHPSVRAAMLALCVPAHQGHGCPQAQLGRKVGSSRGLCPWSRRLRPRH